VASIEVFFGVIVFIFALIGLVRGFLRELGVTTMVMFVLFFLSQFEPYFDSGLVKVMAFAARGGNADLTKELFKCWFFLFLIVGVAFVSYEGETLAFAGEPPRGSQGIVLGLLTGMLNGYLIAGSIWFYMDKFGYPIKFLGFARQGLSSVAVAMVPFLPINFLGQDILMGQSLLLYLSGLLLIARVIR
jgi:hypothetical protein